MVRKASLPMAFLLKLVYLALFIFISVNADETIYNDDALATGWQDWSWGSAITYNATEMKEGTSSIFVNSTQYSALSLKAPSTFQTFAGLKFDISGAQPDLTITIQDTADNTQSASIPLSAFGSPVTASNFSSLLLDFSSTPPNGAPLGNGSWDRITFQAGTNGAIYYIDNIELISSITVTPEFLSAEPLANNLIAVTTAGDVDFSTLTVKLNNKALSVTGRNTISPVDTPSKSITYLTLSSSLAPGNLAITAGNTSFSFSLPTTLSGTINQSGSHSISDRIYGINFPTSASYISDLGVTISRWGGNAVTAYNPFGGFTNAGNDWYFENRDSDSADDWIEWVSQAGSDTLLTVPALDWVSKDNSSFSYPSSLYPDQESFDPYNGVSGDGLFPNGSYVTPVPDQNSVYVPWNTTIAKQWLSNLKNKPTIVAIDNEIEIASNTHQDMHPELIGYDEELARVVNFSIISKEAIPGVEVAAPSTCSWWYYWTSSIGLSDNSAHNNTDFIPWFLTQMKLKEQSSGKRLLDFLDIHYYFQADTSANDAAAKALRLRATRSLWDPTYVDESWIGTNTPSNTQPNATIVQLIPRMRALLSELYPGTKLSVSEWSSTADTDITGGLVTADALGIFGRYQLDSATYWSDPDEAGPVALAYWLYRGYRVQFGSLSLGINIPKLNPDTLGVYASSTNGKNLSLVIVNKDPSSPVALNLSGVPTGNYILRHFGGQAGVAKYQSIISLKSASYLVVPSYTAVFLQQTTSKGV